MPTSDKSDTIKTAKQINADQVGEYSFLPKINSAHIVGGNPSANRILTELFKACGWKVVETPTKLILKKRVKNKPRKIYADKKMAAIRRGLRRSRRPSRQGG